MKKVLPLIALTIAITACQPTKTVSPDEAKAGSGTLTFIVINDTYQLDQLPYLRTLRHQLEQKEGDVAVLHAGDFLFPSLLSRRYGGEQMIDLFNLLDGDDKSRDPYFYITFGNHEFDKDKLKHAPMLQSRINESQFEWINSNVVFKSDAAGNSLVKGSNLLNSKLIHMNGIKVGLVSATTDVKSAEYIDSFLPPIDTVRKITRQLRDKGAQWVVGITHQTVAQDKVLLENLGDDAPDFIAGGHEHDRQNHLVNGRRLVKADADATSAAVVRVKLTQPLAETHVEFVKLPGHYAADASMQTRITQWKERFGKEFCGEINLPSSCLTDVVGRSQVDLIGEELTIRRYETNLGNLLADAAKFSYADKGAQIAFLNSGGMRLNQNIPTGSITRSHVETLFAYPTPLVLLKITGKQLQDVVNHSITDWTGNGRWLHISGFAFRHDPDKQLVTGLSLITPSGLRPIKPDETILAVTNEYLINKSGDRDGYLMLDETLLVDRAMERPDLKEVLIKRLENAGTAGVSPSVEGRICNIKKNSECKFGGG